jgi:hypothetical protein
MTSDQDITVQASGALRLNILMNGLTSEVTLKGLEYGPPSSPAPPWKQPDQYSSTLPQICPMFGYPLNGRPFGCLQPLYIRDLSPKSVLPGKTYRFIIKAGHSIDLSLQLVGSAAGTTVIPGFGIFGLPPNPNGYTYISPEPGWEGEWSMSLRSRWSANLMQLAIEYASAKDFGHGPESAMTFTIGGVVALPFGPKASDGAAPARDDEGGLPHDGADARNHIERASPYRILPLDSGSDAPGHA